MSKTYARLPLHAPISAVVPIHPPFLEMAGTTLPCILTWYEYIFSSDGGASTSLPLHRSSQRCSVAAVIIPHGSALT